MPKVSKVGKFRATAKASSSKSPLKVAPKKDGKNTGDVQAPSEPVLSTGQLKRKKKVDKYLAREQMVLTSLKLWKQEDQKGKLDGLDALRAALPTAKSIAAAKEAAATSGEAGSSSSPEQPETSASVIGTNRSKKDLAGREISHMNLVLKHPSFQENPFAAITAHLRNTLASQGEAQLQESRKQTKKDEEAEAKKKEKKKERLRDAKYEVSRKGGPGAKHRAGNKSGRAAKRSKR